MTAPVWLQLEQVKRTAREQLLVQESTLVSCTGPDPRGMNAAHMDAACEGASRVLGVLNRRLGQGVFPAPSQDLLESDMATVKTGHEVRIQIHTQISVSALEDGS